MLEQLITKQDVKLLNEASQKLNQEYLELLNSKEYQLGAKIIKIKNCILGGRIKSISGYLKAALAEKKIIKTVDPNTLVNPVIGEDDYFINERIAVYTSIFGKYDSLKEPLIKPNNIDYFIITDQKIPDSSMWKKLTIGNHGNFSPAEKNRYAKMHPDSFFESYQYSIYVDGSIKIVSDLTPLIKYIGKAGMAVHKHSQRNCVFDELEYAVNSFKITKKEATGYLKYIQDIKMPKDFGLCECGVIAREHNNPMCKKIMSLWWNQFLRYIKRDQISFPVVLYMSGLQIDDISTLGNNIYSNHLFRVEEHH